MQKIKFGTDGFRGVIADNFTFANVERISRALAVYAAEHCPQAYARGIVIGYDRRFLSDKFAQRAAETLSRCGINVFLSAAAVSTPAVSCFIIKEKLPLGVILTASHNPAVFNGIKIKNSFGASVTGEVTAALERIIQRGDRAPEAKISAKISVVDITKGYVDFLKKYLDLDILKKRRYRLFVDCMHGCGAGIVERILTDTPVRIHSLRPERDVLFSGVSPEPIEKNLDYLKQSLARGGCDLAVAFDGDADRIGAMTPGGRFINSHEVICLLLLHFIENRKFTGKIVKSINTTTLTEKIAAHYGLELEEVPVGFKYIADKMLNEDILLGGEESGGIGFKNYMPERDGILSGLLLLEMMAATKKSIDALLDDMRRRFGPFFYMRRDLHVPGPRRIKKSAQILGKKVVEVKTYDGTKFILEDGSWLIVRSSGTEPIVRIYAESPRKKFTEKLIEYGCGLL